MFCALTSVAVAKLDIGGLEDDDRLETLRGVGPPAAVDPDNTCIF